MKIVGNRGALLEALIMSADIAASRTPKAVLQCVKLTAEQDRLLIAATDQEVAICYVDPQVEVAEPGETLVQANTLRDIVRESIDDTLTLQTTGETVEIRGQDSLFKIFTRDVAEFPPIPALDGEADFQIQGSQLKRMISQTIFAVARESTRYAFNGVLIHVRGAKVEMVGTDGRRLAHAQGELVKPVAGDKDQTKVIIPIKALQLIEKLIGSADEAVDFQLRDNRILVRTSNATLVSSLVEGQFPPYDDVIPKDSDKRMVAGTADLLSATRRSALLSTEESRGVRMKFSKDGLTLSSQSPDAGEATVNFPCKYEGADLEIGFNPAFVVDALKVVNSDEVTLELSAANRPALLRAGSNFQYVIMPVNLP